MSPFAYFKLMFVKTLKLSLGAAIGFGIGALSFSNPDAFRQIQLEEQA